MKIYVDGRLLEERVRYDLRACCEDCVHFCEGDGSCSLTFPVAPHRAAHHAALKVGDGVLYCKTFEVG